MTTKSFKSAIDRELSGLDYYSITDLFQKESYIRKDMKPSKTLCAIVFTGEETFPYRVFYNFARTMKNSVNDTWCETLDKAYEQALNLLG